MRKAGVCFAQDVKEWFNPFDGNHMNAYDAYLKTGEWPEGFVASDIWLTPGWEEALKDKVARYRAEKPLY